MIMDLLLYHGKNEFRFKSWRQLLEFAFVMLTSTAVTPFYNQYCLIKK